MPQRPNKWLRLLIWIILVCIPIQGLIGAILLQIVGALAVIFAVIYAIKTQKIRKFDNNDILALIFAFWGILSFFWAQDTQISLQVIITQLQLIIFLFLLRSIINNLETILFLVKGYIVGVLLVAIGIINAYLHEFNAFSRYTIGNMNAGFVGGVLALGISPAIMLSISAPRRLGRILGIIYLPTAALAIILTGTRTSAIAAMASALVFLAPYILRRNQYQKIILCIFLVLIIGFGLAFIYFPNMVIRFTKIYEAIITGRLSGREYIWPVAIDTFSQHPLIGVGIGSFSLVAEKILGYRIVAHNTWLSVVAELGLVGLIIFCAMNISMLFSVMQTSGSIRLFGCSLALAWFINATMGTDTYLKTTWMVYALISSLPKIQHNLFGRNILHENKSATCSS